MAENEPFIEGSMFRIGRRIAVGGAAILATAIPMVGPGSPVAFADSDRPWWKPLTCEEQAATRPGMKCPGSSSSGSAGSSSGVGESKSSPSSDRPWWKPLTCEEQAATRPGMKCPGSSSSGSKSGVGAPWSGVPKTKPYEPKLSIWEKIARSARETYLPEAINNKIDEIERAKDPESYIVTDGEPWFVGPDGGNSIAPFIVTDGQRWGYNPDTKMYDAEGTIITDGKPWDYDPATGRYYER